MKPHPFASLPVRTLSLPSRDTNAQAFPVLEPLSGYRMRLDIYVNGEGLEPRLVRTEQYSIERRGACKACLYSLVKPSLVPRPSRAPARKRVWNLSQDFLALLNQRDDVFERLSCAFGRAIRFQCEHNTLGNWNWNRAVLQYALKSHD